MRDPDIIFIKHCTPLFGTNLASNKNAFKFCFLSSFAFENGEGILSITYSSTLSTFRPAFADIYCHVSKIPLHI